MTKASARYAVSFENIINPADREYWIAGTTVMITDTKTQELIAKKTWYSFEPGFGSHAGNRQPWRFALTCPDIKGEENHFPTRFYVDQILKPKQGN
ncbi:hypothetical protein AVKW3434_14570 [Acidovorax sp. SUPP3434]|nr:hypothetical protein AVKW3434_14570 [Acidovorax sp. SUPP3434]